MTLYCIFLTTIAIKNGTTPIAILVCVSCLLIVILSSARLIHALYHPNVQKNDWVLTRYLNAKVTKPYFLFFPEWILRQQPLMMIGTKLFSGIILLGVSELYKTDHYDLRLMGMGTVMAFSANINIIWELHRFNNIHLSILRNLPIPLVNRIGYFMVTTLLLLIPEIGVIVKHFLAGFNALELLSVVLFGISIPVLFYGCLYLEDRGKDQLMTIVFFIAIALTLVILFQIPLIILAFINFCVGCLFWKFYYYTFEPIAR